MMNEAEQIVVEFLTQWGLTAQRFSKHETREQGKQTPDFRVSKDGQFEFFCEVKETTDADPLEDHFVEVKPGIEVAEQFKVGDRSRHYRIAKHVHKAVKQFDSVNPKREHPNVLAFVNRDEMCVPSDLTELLVGYLPTDTGLRICTSPWVAREQIWEDRLQIHLFVWLNRNPHDEPSHRFFFWAKHDEPTKRLRHLFVPENRKQSVANTLLSRTLKRNADADSTPMIRTVQGSRLESTQYRPGERHVWRRS